MGLLARPWFESHPASARHSGGVTNPRRQLDGADDEALLALFAAIASGEHLEVEQRLRSSSDLAHRAIRVGATRQHDPDAYFLTAVRNHVYAGDTALHIAAAAHRREVAATLVGSGAGVRARNRRGAEPLHYAADGSPGGEHWDPAGQREVIAYLVEAGADPNAVDKSGVAPLHRAVRTRCSVAVDALIRRGADPLLTNKRCSTALHLAVQNTGRSDSGSEAARDEQRRIIAVLLAHGARPSDVDANGKSVMDAAASDWVRQLLST